AASFGGTNIDPSAWEGKKNPGESRFPAQHKDFWTEEEDRILIAAHAEMGNKWAKWPRPSPIFQNYIKSLNLPIGRMNSNRSNNDQTHTLPVVKPLSSVTELEDFGFNDVLEFPMDEKLLEWDDDNIQSLFDSMPCNNRGGEEKVK
ncbi:transcription factor MYB98-like protein, partial [Tanacetum coccineum]